MYGLYQNQERNRVHIGMSLFNYLKYRSSLLLLICASVAVNAVVLFIYGSPTEPTLYALVISLVFLCLIGIYDYLRQRRKHRILAAYDSTSKKSLQELLPESNMLASDYQTIIARLEQQQKDSTNAQLQREKELSDFYTMWVHQIKTPIAALRLLQQTSPENITGMKSELFKIERYVDIILGYLRMEDMHQDLVLKHYSLEALVKQAVKKYTPLFIQSKLALNLENFSVNVLTDEKWLVFALEQLLSNAIKYTPEGGIHIYATTTQSDGVVKSTLAIQDTGIGIYPEDLPRIFERSFTGYNGRADKKASGLGLYLCKTILKRLGHEISITSEPQKGTCVTITFTENQNLRPMS